MKLLIDNLTYLWLIPLALGGILIPYIKYSKKSQRQKLFTGLRIIAIGLLILSLAGIKIVKTAKDTTTIFVADLSDSTKDKKPQIEKFITNGIKEKSNKDLIAVIGFGADSQGENHPSKDIIFNGFQTKVNSNFTNIQGGLLNAAALFPANTKKRIVLITDGLENMGESERQIRALKQNNVVIDVYPLEKADFEEVQLSKIQLPQKAGKNQVIEIEAHIDSNIKTRGEILLYQGNNLKAKEKIDIDIGTNKYIFTDTISSNGILNYKIEIIPEKDTYSKNNQLTSFITVKDKPLILLIQDEDKQGDQIIKMLEEDINIEAKSPEEAPETLEELIKYDAFILSNIPGEKLSQTFQNNLEKTIKNQGKGILVTGGDASFGAGGYQETRLEEILPVKSNPKSKEEKPNLGLILVIDKSGSMTEGKYGITRLDLAKEAAIRSTQVLEENDTLGVIAFDDTIKWVIEPQLANNKEALQDKIATIVPGGGTSIRPSLEAAVDALIKVDTKLKHIILLTDGQAETTGYEASIRKLGENSITLSTVAVGQGADKNLLKFLANAGGGRYYSTDEFTDIPSIFTKETFMAGKKYLNNVSFLPNLVNQSEILKQIEEIPKLDGYVATSIKPNSKLILAGPENDPILATGQYGLGRTIAWTSDTKGIWTKEWMNWENSLNFFNNLINYLVQQDIDNKYTIETSYKSGKGIITVKSQEKETSLTKEIQGILITPEGEEKTVSLEATSPGTYTGNFEAPEEGVYLINLALENNQQITTGLNVGYSPEYNFFTSTGITAERIIDLSGGRILKDPKEIFKGNLPNIRGTKDISKILLTLSLIIILLEIYLRKTETPLANIKIKTKQSKTRKSQEKENQEKEAIPTTHTRLLEKKRK